MNLKSHPSRGALWRLRSLVSLVFVGAFAAALPASTGIVTGHVTNAGTKEPLWSAAVTVKGTNLTATTDRDGSFRLRDVPAGEQSLVVSYTGLDTVEKSVTVAAGASVAQDVSLTAGYYELDRVVVKGIKEGQALAIQQQKQAPNSKVVSALDAFGNPSANPGELVQRLSEVTTEIIGSEVRGVYIRGMSPEYSVLQVDGQQAATARGTGASREYQIEQMGTASLQSIELIKAPRPQDDANSIAGFVNLISKRAFDTPGRRINLTLGTMWRTRESGENPFQDEFNLSPDLIALSYSDTLSLFGGKNNLGIAINASRRLSATTQDEFGSGMTFIGPGALFFSSPTAAPLTRSFGSGDFYYDALAQSYSASIDYKLPNGYLYVRTSYNTNDQDQRFFRWDIRANAAASSFTPTSTSALSEVVPHAGSFAEAWTALFEKNSVNYSVNPGISLKLMDGTAQLDASLFYSYADIIYPNYNTGLADTQAVAPGGLGWSLNYGPDKDHPIFTQTAGASFTDPASYTVRLNQHIHWWSPSELSNAKVDFKKEMSWSIPVSLQVGAKRSVSKQDQYRDWENRSAWSGPTGIASFLGARYRQVGGRYGPFPFLTAPGLGGSTDILSSPFLALSDADAYTNYSLSTAADAEFKETISAGYLQAQARIGRLTVLAGVRMEKTDTESHGYANNVDPQYNFNALLTRAENLARVRAKYTPISTSGSYDNVFPGLHLNYYGPGGMVYRASYNKSITRPPIAQTLAITTVNPTASTPTVSQGNPNLKPYESNNFEVSVEKYFEPIGKFTVGGFLKKTSNYFTTFTSTVGSGNDNGFDGQFAGYVLSRVENIGEGEIKGFNIDYAQQFTFLPGFLRGLGAFANYTWLEAEGNFTPNAANTAVFSTLPGLVPRSGNFGLSYVDAKFQIRLMANYRSKFILTTPAGNVANESNIGYRGERMMIDLKTLYRINPRFDVYLDIYNMFDEPTSTYNTAGRENFTLTQGTSFSAGVNVRF